MARTYDAATTSPERALEWLRRWYDVSGALKVEDLAARIGLDYEYMLLPRQVTGCLVYEGKGRFIALINRRLSVPKRRMALAHAMGHWSMHPVQSRNIVCELGTSDPLEVEAQSFARLLLGDSFVASKIPRCNTISRSE